MNIFVVDADPVRAAQQLCDRHVVKMTVESAQILSTVSFNFGVPGPYLPTHRSHPATRWAGASRENWFWLFEHFCALGREYTYRYERSHRTMQHADRLFAKCGRPRDGSLTAFARVFPAVYASEPDTVVAYRQYMIDDKTRFACFTRRERPAWWPKKLEIA